MGVKKSVLLTLTCLAQNCLALSLSHRKLLFLGHSRTFPSALHREFDDARTRGLGFVLINYLGN
jgi:hypothetical protein